MMGVRLSLTSTIQHPFSHKTFFMVKRLFAIAVAVMLSAAASAQKTLESTQLMTRGLYPTATMDNLQFVGKTNKVAFVKDSALYMGNANSAKPILKLSELNRMLSVSNGPQFRRLPDMKVLNENEIVFGVNGKTYCYNIAKKSLVAKSEDYNIDDNGVDVSANPDNFAYADGSALVIRYGVKKARLDENNPDIIFGQSVHRNEFGISKGTFWSPKGNKLAFYRMDQTMVTDYPMVNTKSRIASPAPFKYPMAGMKSHEVTVGIYSGDQQNIVYLQTRKDTSVAEREMYLTNLTWSPDEQYLYIAKINREQNHMWLERYDVATGKFDKVLFEETNPRYVEPTEGLYFLPNDPNQFLWFSMRDGYKHLYQYRTDGTLVRQLTTGEYEVEGVIGFDAKGANLFVYANKDNLAGRAAYRVNMKSGEMERITPAEGTHEVVISNDGTQLIDKYASVNVPARAALYNMKGKELYRFYDAPNPLADYAMPGITLGTIKAADGTTDLYYRLITPPDMDPNKKYPTLVYVYGGPHSQLVTDDWLGGGNLYFTFLAQQGYVVFTLDNRGTDNRGFEFESCTHRQLGTIELADQMEGVKFLQSLPYVDQQRMGVEGWSFGGFMTITMKLAHPEIFKVGCAGGPVIDWKWYEVMYGERYMDTPQENPEGYENASLLNKAKNLQGRLLVIHGAEDNTVVWQNSIEFIERCINNNLQVDYFIYPHHEHNVRGRERVHLYQKMFDYYETHLK